MHKLKRASDLTSRNQALEEIQEALGLAEVPLRIECYDVSNLQGTEVVASMVVFEDGLARKSEYRRFVIKGVDGQNDVASMHEVITRRFRRLLDEQARERGGARTESGPMLVDPETGRPRKFAYAPGLVVVDGGPPQVAAAKQALDELGIDDIPVCGLAKRLEEVWLPGQADPVILARTSEGLYLLQRIRDEAHRFAITHHRSRRSKTMVESLLDDVPGLGEVRRKTLLKHFGSLKKLREATADDIAMVPGIGPQTAAAIKEAVETERRDPQDCLGQHRHRRDRGVMSDEQGVDPPEQVGDLVVVTGMTGAGRSTAAKELEDLGFYVVDNLPPSLLPDVVRLVDESLGLGPADGGRRRRTLRLLLPHPARQPRPGRPRPQGDAGLPRRHRRGARTPAGGRPATAPAPGQRPPARRPAPRAPGAGRPAQRRRPGDRHQRPQRAPAHRPRSPRRSAPRSRPGSR